MKRTIIFLSLLLAVVVSASAAGKRTSKYPGYKYGGTSVSKMYYAGGSPVVGYLTCSYYCIPETDDCIFEYKFGKAPRKGVALTEVFKENEIGDLYCYSKKKNQSIRNEFAKLTGQPYNRNNGSYTVLANGNGTIMLYIYYPINYITHAWLIKNGKMVESYWIMD